MELNLLNHVWTAAACSLCHRRILRFLHHYLHTLHPSIFKILCSGIGRISSIALSQAGWNVVLFARREDELKDAAHECPGQTLVVQGDVTSETDVIRLFSEAVKAFGE